MSWYNNQSQGFIDATQELQSGGGEGQVEYYTEASDVFIPKVLDETNASYDTLIVNNTANARIFIKNQNAEPKIRIEGGKFFLYYEYDFTNAPTIPSGWIEMDTYVTAIKQGLVELGADLIALNAYVFTPNLVTPPNPLILQGKLALIDASITTISFEVQSLEGDLFLLEGRVTNIENQMAFNRETGDEFLPDAMDTSMEPPRTNQSVTFEDWAELINNPNVSSAGIQQGGSVLPYSASVAQSIEAVYVAATLTWSSYLQYVLVGLGGGAALLTLYYLSADNTKEINLAKTETKTLLALEKLSKISTADNPTCLHKDGLLIIGSTNNGFNLINDYTVNLSNGGQLVIEVKLVAGVKVASILKVKKIGTATFNVNDIINIPKSSLGGTTGDLQIQVTSLISERQVLQNILLDIEAQRGQIYNRRRLRDGIINTNELGDGLTTVYNSSITNTDTGEVLQIPTIKLNLNSGQLETINGALNIIKYVNSDTTDAIAKLLLPTGATLTSDYKLNLGYKEIFSGFAYDLIMMAVKNDTYTTFTPSIYNNDYLGYWPNMGRVANVGDVKVSYTNGLLVNSSQHFTKGLIYFKNTNVAKTFNMNRKFEFVTFLNFVSFNNNVTDYHLLQTGKEGLVEIDDKKLSVYIRNRKIKVQHPALVSYLVFTNGINSVKRLVNSPTYQIREPFAGLNDNIILEAENLNFANYKYRYRMLNVPYLINGGSQYINTPTGFLKITDSLPNTSQVTEDTKFLAMYLNHPSNPNEPIANCIWPSVDYLMGINDNGTVMTGAEFTIPWHIKRVVLRFDVALHRVVDENSPEGGVYLDWPVLYHEIDQSLKSLTNYALSFRIRYSFDGVNFVNHDFSIYDVFNQGGFVGTGTTIRTGFYNNMILPKRYLTYTLEIPNTYPNYGVKVRTVEFLVIKKTGITYFPSNSTASTPYNKQPVIFLYEFNAEEYGLTETGATQVIYDKYATTDTLTTLNNINLNQQYLTTLQLDLPNDTIKYGLNTSSYTLSNRSSVKIYAGDQVDIPMPHPDIPFVTATFVSWAKLTQDNSILVVGNNPSEGQIVFTHFNWRFFQNSEAFLVSADITKLMGLILYNYYYDYVNVDKLLDTNEIFANSINTNRLMIGSNVITNNLSAAQRAISLRTNQTQDAGNLLIDITKLYVDNPTSSGSLTYNHTTKVFGIGTSSGGVGTRSEEDAITLALIEDSAGTGLQWNATNNTLNVIPESLWQDLTPIYTAISTNDTNVSNYVWNTSNYLKSEIDSILPYDDTAVYTQITTTSNILFTDFVARDALLVADYIARDDIIVTDSIDRDDNLSASIEANKYTDTKVQTYLSSATSKNIGSDLTITNTNKLQFEAGTPAIPAIITGGTGAKIIYYPSATTFPYSTGVSASTLWSSVPTGATHRFYVNGTECLRSLVNQTVIASTGEAVNAILGLGTPFPGVSKYGSAIIAEAWNSWSRSNLCLCVNNIADNFNSASLSNVRMRIWYFSYTEFYGTGTSTQTNYTYMLIGQSTNAYANTTHAVSVKVNGAIWATGVIATSSSREIKKDIEELEDQECLNKLLRLKPCKYRYIDNKRNFHPTKKVFGFIAEEVKEVIPEAVDDTLKELIPNIYEIGSFEGDILTISKVLEIGVEYTCYAEENDDAILITPLEDMGGGNYRINKSYETKKSLLVYGKTITNFHALKKEYFHALCVSSIQEHHKIIMEQKNKINDLETRLAKLEAIVSGILSGSI